ncbi:hypothetical protein SO3561_09872 [Streptomyces olivochromogenes]|uniref:Uncharacterized protein n=1 Tax=Streptomyces olivochromogenes TaxID=1963 RepID=A0A250VWF8_STROL|nr:hypothetical protein SO3561_09872 [Streptomyces olivochromogenes]
MLGTPLNPDTYDYEAAVLWNAHAGPPWRKLIQRNPCRIKGAGKEKAAERRIATVAQVDALAEAVGARWRLVVHLGSYGRRGGTGRASLRG